jgi:hypothetical protein
MGRFPSTSPVTTKEAPSSSSIPAAFRSTIGAYPLGTIRLSLSYLNTSEQIDLALDGISRIAVSPVAA